MTSDRSGGRMVEFDLHPMWLPSLSRSGMSASAPQPGSLLFSPSHLEALGTVIPPIIRLIAMGSTNRLICVMRRTRCPSYERGRCAVVAAVASGIESPAAAARGRREVDGGQVGGVRRGRGCSRRRSRLAVGCTVYPAGIMYRGRWRNDS